MMKFHSESSTYIRKSTGTKSVGTSKFGALILQVVPFPTLFNYAM